MTDRIREAFEKWWKEKGEGWASYNEKIAARKGYLAGRQSLLDELEQVGFTAMSGHGRVFALQPTVQPEKWEPIYRLSEGVTK